MRPPIAVPAVIFVIDTARRPISVRSNNHVLIACALAILVFGALNLQAAEPVIDGPTNYAFNHCETGLLNFVAAENEYNVPYEWEIVSGPGTIVATGAQAAQWTMGPRRCRSPEERSEGTRPK